MKRNVVLYVFGVLDFIEDVCKQTGEKTQIFQLALNCLMIDIDTWSHMFPLLKSKMTLVKGPWELDEMLDKNWYMYDFFEKREDGQ